MFKRSRILNPVRRTVSVQDAVCYLKGEGQYADREQYPFPTLLFIDLHLSDGSGFDILRWIGRHQAQSPAGVVVLSGSDVNAFRTAYELGADSFLVKPLNFQEFQNMVRHVRGIQLVESGAGFVLDVE